MAGTRTDPGGQSRVERDAGRLDELFEAMRRAPRDDDHVLCLLARLLRVKGYEALGYAEPLAHALARGVATSVLAAEQALRTAGKLADILTSHSPVARPASAPGEAAAIRQSAGPPGPAKTGPAKTGPAKTGPAKTGPAQTGPAEEGSLANGAGATPRAPSGGVRVLPRLGSAAPPDSAARSRYKRQKGFKLDAEEAKLVAEALDAQRAKVGRRLTDSQAFVALCSEARARSWPGASSAVEVSPTRGQVIGA